jgi:hypothetical protein
LTTLSQAAAAALQTHEGSVSYDESIIDGYWDGLFNYDSDSV